MRAPHVGDLFGPLVDEQHDQLDLGVVLLDRRRDRLHHGRLAGLGGRHDDAALALADRAHEVDDAGRHVGRVGRVFHPQPLRRGTAPSGPRTAGGAWRTSGGRPLTEWISSTAGFFSLRPAGRLIAGHVVALAQPVLAGQLDRHVRVALAGEVVVDAEEAVALVAQVEVAVDLDRLVADRRRRARPRTPRRHGLRPAGRRLAPPRFLRRRRRRLLRLSPSSYWLPRRPVDRRPVGRRPAAASVVRAASAPGARLPSTSSSPSPSLASPSSSPSASSLRRRRERVRRGSSRQVELPVGHGLVELERRRRRHRLLGRPVPGSRSAAAAARRRRPAAAIGGEPLLAARRRAARAPPNHRSA